MVYWELVQNHISFQFNDEWEDRSLYFVMVDKFKRVNRVTDQYHIS